jgi:hypothetical protein
MRPSPAFSLLFSICLAWQTCPAQEPAVELRLHWEPGQFYLQETDTDTTTFLTALGQKHDQKLRMRQTTSIKVKPGPAGGSEARVTIDSLKGEMVHDGLLLPFDADKMEDAHPMLQKAVGRASGKSFTLVYDAADQFQDVQDIGSMVRGGTTPDLGSIADAKQVALLFRRSLEMGLPRIPVRPGDKWLSEENISFAEAGQVKVRLNAKFEEFTTRETRRHAKISFAGGMESQADEKTRKALVTVGKDSQITGHVFFDLERRTVSLSVLLAVVNLEVEGKKLPVRQQVTTRLVAMKTIK